MSNPVERLDEIQNKFFQKYSKTAEFHTVIIIVLTVLLLQVDTGIKYNYVHIGILTVASSIFTLVWHQWASKKINIKYINKVELGFHIIALNTLIALTGGASSIFLFYAILPVYRIIGITKFSDNLIIISIIETILLIFLIKDFSILNLAKILPEMVGIIILDSAMVSEANILIEVESSFVREQAKTEQLEEVNKYKDEFVYLASHELRSPLTVTKGYLDLLVHEKDTRFSDKGKDIVSHLQTSVDNLNRIIEDLLNVSRMERGKATLKKTEVKIKQTIDLVVEEIKINAKAKNIELNNISNLNGEEKSFTDETRIKEIVMNLLDNAIKYTPTNGHVHIESDILNNNIIIKITDSGIGIPLAEKPQIAKKFYRASNASTISSKGTGLGLYAVYKIVEMLNGKIDFTSEINKGTTFSVQIPVESSPNQPAVVAGAELSAS